MYVLCTHHDGMAPHLRYASSSVWQPAVSSGGTLTLPLLLAPRGRQMAGAGPAFFSYLLAHRPEAAGRWTTWQKYNNTVWRVLSGKRWMTNGLSRRKARLERGRLRSNALSCLSLYLLRLCLAFSSNSWGETASAAARPTVLDGVARRCCGC